MDTLFIQSPNLCLGYLQTFNTMYNNLLYMSFMYTFLWINFCKWTCFYQWVYIFLKVLMCISKFEGIISLYTRILVVCSVGVCSIPLLLLAFGYFPVL